MKCIRICLPIHPMKDSVLFLEGGIMKRVAINICIQILHDHKSFFWGKYLKVGLLGHTIKV